MAHGSDPVTASKEAYAAAFGMVQRQAALMSYLDTFRFFGVVFFLLLPLIFLMRRPVHQRGGVAMH